jgi:hypothetical protein
MSVTTRDKGDSMKNSTSKGLERLDQAYALSWYNRLSAWVDGSRLPNGLVYALIPVLWILVALLAQRLDGSGSIRDWEPISFVAISQIAYIFFIIQFLDKLALKALTEFKSALTVEAEAYPRLERLISTLPARTTRIATALFGLVGILLIILSISGNLDSTVAPSSGYFGVVIALTMLFLWFSNGLFVYHTYHQLSVVNYIFTHLTEVHPFHQRELFAFSTFSAQTGIAIVIVTPLWIIFDPGIVSLVVSIIFAILGLIAFISPLFGVHNMLEREKDRLLDENAREVETTIETLMIEIKKPQPEGLKLADQRLTSLERARSQIERISTWPWRIETLRQMLAAVILPIIIWLLQYLLAQILSG